MDWDRLRVFYFVAQSGSFTAASRLLHISQPAVSRCIIILEERMQVVLFYRGARGLELTKEGAILYKHVLRMFAEANEALNEINGKDIEPEGSLKVLTTHALASTWLIDYMKGFNEAYPDIRVTIAADDNKTKFDETDAAIRPFFPDQPELIQRYLTTFHLRLFASQEYLDKFGAPRTPEELDHHRLITYGDNKVHAYLSSPWILRVGRKAGDLREPFMVLHSVHARFKAAKLGLGIVELGEEHPASENCPLIEVLPEIEGPKVEVFYTYPLHLKNSKKVTVLGDYLEEQIAQTNQIKQKQLLPRNGRRGGK